SRATSLVVAIVIVREGIALAHPNRLPYHLSGGGLEVIGKNLGRGDVVVSGRLVSVHGRGCSRGLGRFMSALVKNVTVADWHQHHHHDQNRQDALSELRIHAALNVPSNGQTGIDVGSRAKRGND